MNNSFDGKASAGTDSEIARCLIPFVKFCEGNPRDAWMGILKLFMEVEYLLYDLKIMIPLAEAANLMQIRAGEKGEGRVRLLVLLGVQYLCNEELDKAESVFLEALNLTPIPGSDYFEAQPGYIHRYLSKVHAKRGNQLKFISHLVMALRAWKELSKEVHTLDFDEASEACEELAKVLKKAGRTSEAEHLLSCREFKNIPEWLESLDIAALFQEDSAAYAKENPVKTGNPAKTENPVKTGK